MLELFHAIADPQSARVRSFIVERDLVESVRFRNVTYPEVRADLTAHGETRTPALWDGATLTVGAEAIIDKLSTAPAPP